MLQTPVPVVVIVRAEELGTVTYIQPRAAVESHSHVVLAADPRRHLRLTRKLMSTPSHFNIQNYWDI